MHSPMQQHALKWGGRRESASTSSRVFQTGGEEASDDKWNVDTLIYDVVSRLRQWGGVGGGEKESRCGWVQVRTWPNSTCCQHNKSLLTLVTKVC